MSEEQEWDVVTCIMKDTDGYDVFISKDKKRLRLYCTVCGRYIEFLLKEK
jgi:hypothetical protein